MKEKGVGIQSLCYSKAPGIPTQMEVASVTVERKIHTVQTAYAMTNTQNTTCLLHQMMAIVTQKLSD